MLGDSHSIVKEITPPRKKLTQLVQPFNDDCAFNIQRDLA